MGVHTGYKEGVHSEMYKQVYREEEKWKWGTKEVLGKAKGD